jgi:protein-disulfide isomerase
MKSLSLLAVGLVAFMACGGATPADVEEIKKSQKEILDKLASLEKTVKEAPRAPTPPARPQIDPNKVYDLPVGNSAVRGPKTAKVTITEFADYQCPFCAQSAPLVEEVMKAYPNDVNFVYKQFPLTSIHPNALPAAKATVAAGKQGKFWEMHDRVFKGSREISPEKLKEWAKEVGLDVAKWEADFNSPEVQAEIDKDTATGRTADVQGTPTFFVNGKRVMNRSVDGFKAMIDSELKQKG